MELGRELNAIYSLLDIGPKAEWSADCPSRSSSYHLMPGTPYISISIAWLICYNSMVQLLFMPILLAPGLAVLSFKWNTAPFTSVLALLSCPVRGDLFLSSLSWSIGHLSCVYSVVYCLQFGWFGCFNWYWLHIHIYIYPPATQQLSFFAHAKTSIVMLIHMCFV